MNFISWICIIYTAFTLVCFVWLTYAIKKAPLVDPQEPFLKGDIKSEDLEEDKEE